MAMVTHKTLIVLCKSKALLPKSLAQSAQRFSEKEITADKATENLRAINKGR